MKKLLTNLDIAIIEALHNIGPRNLTKVADSLGISRETLIFRMRRMSSNPHIFLRCHASVYHTNLGLKKAVVFADAVPGREQMLFECMKAHDFRLYVGRSYKGVEGCDAVYAVPFDHCRDFEEYAYELKRLNVAQDITVFWSTCFQGGQITSKWFEKDNEKWIFPWNELILEIQNASTRLPYTLVEPDAFVNHADEIDVFILKELEKDATISFSKIGAKLNVTSQCVGMHFRNHILPKGLLEGYQIFVLPFSEPCDMYVFVISFYDHEKMAKFANSLLDKSFVIMVGKLFGRNALITNIHLPKVEFRKFIDALSLLSEMRIVKNYHYITQDLRIRSKQTIPYEFFKNNKWIYDHPKHLAKLEAIAKK